MIYYNTQGIRSANDLIQIMNIGNQPYSSLSLLARQAYLMQSELPTAPNVFDTDYQLVLFTKKLLQRDISTERLSKEPLSHSYLKWPMEGTREEHNSVMIKLTMSSKNITRFVRATKFLETNDKNGRCLNQWTMFLAANQPQNLEWLT